MRSGSARARLAKPRSRDCLDGALASSLGAVEYVVAAAPDEAAVFVDLLDEPLCEPARSEEAQAHPVRLDHRALDIGVLEHAVERAGQAAEILEVQHVDAHPVASARCA